MGKPKNEKRFRSGSGADGAGKVTKARKGPVEEPAGEDEKRKFKHTQQFNFERGKKFGVRQAVKNSSKGWPIQRRPVLRLFEKHVHAAAVNGETHRVTTPAREAVMDATVGVVYDVLLKSYNCTVIGRKKQTLAVRDIMLYLTSHPEYSRLIGIDALSYCQAGRTGNSSLTAKSITDLGGQKAAGAVLTTRTGRVSSVGKNTSITSSKKEKKSGGPKKDADSKKAGKKKKTTTKKASAAAAKEADPEATIDPNAAMQDDDAASVAEEEEDAMQLE
jgi:hypothetical protein